MKVTKSMMALAATLTGATGAMAAGESVEVAKFDKRSPVRSIRAKIKVRNQRTLDRQQEDSEDFPDAPRVNGN